MIRLIIYYIIFALNVVLWKGFTLADEERCVLNDARKAQCGVNEVCINFLCQCKPGYTRLNNSCAKNVPNSNSVPSPSPVVNDLPDEHNSSIAAAVIIPIMLILIVIGAVVLIRKYNIITWVRNKINQRQTSYDEVMIGQDDDDPPLAGV